MTTPPKTRETVHFVYLHRRDGDMIRRACNWFQWLSMDGLRDAKGELIAMNVGDDPQAMLAQAVERDPDAPDWQVLIYEPPRPGDSLPDEEKP